MTVELWTSTGFLEQVREWVTGQARGSGLELTGEYDQPHARVWSSAVRFETSGGRLWFKVNGPGTRHEPALLQVLARRVPALVPELLGVHLGNGWSLSRDAGPTLRQALSPEQSWAAWESVVASYAEAQVQLAGEREAVLGAGVREVSPRTVPEHAAALVRELGMLPRDQGGLSAEEVDRLSGVLPRLVSRCAELGSSGVPDSVQHDDLHSGNVCWNGSAGTARVIDWGDTTWGFPLATMLTTLASVAFHAVGPEAYVDGQPDTPEVLRVRDAYLEPFTAFATRTDLRRLVDVARATGCVGKAMSWRAALHGAPVSGHADHDFPVRTWLLDLLQA